jgi:hypothetical protein
VGPVSATVGLSANTGASIGFQRTGAKLLGTGVYMGTDGIDLSFLGSSFKIRLF